MPLECGIIFDGISEGAISRKVGLIWGIPAKTIPFLHQPPLCPFTYSCRCGSPRLAWPADQRSMNKRVYYGWYVAGAASGIEFANAATAIAILTIFIIPMTDEFGWTRTQLSAATSLGAVLGATLAPITGRLVDRNGARLPLVLGGVLVASACMYLASVQTLLGFYVAFAITRTADQGLIKIGAPPAVGKWFDRHRGRAIALVFFGGSAGIVLLAPVVQLVIGAWGWRAAWRLLGALMLCLGVVPCLALIRRPPQGQETDPDPRLAPEPTPGGSHRLETSAGDIVSQGNVWSLGAVARTRGFWLVLLSLFLASTSTAGITLHLVPYLTQQGLGAGKAVGVISLMSASSAASIVAVGFLAERVSPRVLMAWLYLVMTAGILVLVTTAAPAQAYLFGALHGVASGGSNTLAPILWAKYYGRDVLGSLHGVSRACQVAGFALGPLVLGAVYDSTGGYRPALIFAAVAAMSAFFSVMLSRLPQNTNT